jgi:long-chain acyl-CoA synthetase
MSLPNIKNLAQSLEENASRFPNKTSIIYERLVYTYESLNELVNKAGNAFLNLGIRKGDRVIISLLNGPEFVISFYALAKIGAIAVPINYLLTKNEEKYVWEDSEAGLIITDTNKFPEFHEMTAGAVPILVVGQKEEEMALSGALKFWGQIKNEPDRLSPCPCTQEEVVHILYTSGTTGKPKGAMLTHYSVMYCSSLYTDNDNMGEIFSKESGVICALPLYHCYGQNVCLITPLSAGATVILIDRFNTEKVLQAITDHRATIFAGVPTMYAYLTGGLNFAVPPGPHSPLKLPKASVRKQGLRLSKGMELPKLQPRQLRRPLDRIKEDMINLVPLEFLLKTANEKPKSKLLMKMERSFPQIRLENSSLRAITL